MITKYSLFNESIKHLLKGPTEDEIFDNLKDSTPNELLKKSCKIGFLKGVNYALENGADLYLTDGMVLSEMKEILKLNYDEVFDLIKDLEPKDLLTRSIEVGSIKSLKLAISKGADFSHLGAEQTILHISVVNGYYDIVKWILDKGIKDLHWDWYIRLARKDKHYDIVELLKEYKHKFISSKFINSKKKEIN